MTQKGWQNLALAAILFFYVLQIGFDLITHNTCGNLAIDYCAYWSAGKIATMTGYTDIYNLDIQAQIQKSIHPQGNNPSIPFQVVPVPYLPLFVIPFQLLSFLSLESSFWIWTLLNMLGFIYYLRFFIKETTGITPQNRLVFMVMLSLPVFLNLFWGQVNIFLGICAGEFIRAKLSNKHLLAGLWLGGWLLKPQLLIIIIPILLIQHSKKELLGFAISAISIFVISFGLINVKGFLILTNLFLGYAKGMPTNGPEIMMNWRMLGLHLSNYFSPVIGWTVIAIGTILTLQAVLIISKKLADSDFTRSIITLTGLFAATGVVTWHAHLSMSIILIPPIMYLYVNKRFPEKLLLLWTLMPTSTMLIIYILAAFIQANILPMPVWGLLDLLAGLRGLILNLIILAWVIMEHSKKGLPEGNFQSSNTKAICPQD